MTVVSRLIRPSTYFRQETIQNTELRPCFAIEIIDVSRSQVTRLAIENAFNKSQLELTCPWRCVTLILRYSSFQFQKLSLGTYLYISPPVLSPFFN